MAVLKPARGDIHRCDSHVFTCQTAPIVPAAQMRPGLELNPHLRGGGAPTGARVRRHSVGRAMCVEDARERALRRGTSGRLRGALRPRTRAFRSPPWRFLAEVPRFRLQHFLHSPCSELLAARSECLAGGVHSASKTRVNALTASRVSLRPRAQSRDSHTSLRIQGPSPEHAPR